MPNTPAAIGRGITVACPNAKATAAQAELAQSLLEAVGEAVIVRDEALLDPVTALSGSGPAYVFLLIEAMAEAGVAAGLPRDLAARLALVTVAGAGQLALESAEPPAKLRENVTSPGGTTFAALQVLMAEEGMPGLMRRAIGAATRRSRELAG
jgi:pyrroline-5-carboxylate reductase